MSGKTLGEFARTSTRITYGELWKFCDAARQHAELQADAYERDLSATPAPLPESAEFYRRRIVAHQRDAAYFIALAKLVERYERGDVIKAEVKRMAEAERKARAGGDVVMIEPEGDADVAEYKSDEG